MPLLVCHTSDWQGQQLAVFCSLCTASTNLKLAPQENVITHRLVDPTSNISGADTVDITTLTTLRLQRLIERRTVLLQRVCQQHDAVLACQYRALALALCTIAATTSTEQELQAAEAYREQVTNVLSSLRRAMRKRDGNAMAMQQVLHLRMVVDSVLQRKRGLLEQWAKARALLEPPVGKVTAAECQEASRKVAAAMATASFSHEAKVVFMQLADGQVFADQQCVAVDFGVMLTGSDPAIRSLRVHNKTQGPLRVDLVHAAIRPDEAGVAVGAGPDSNGEVMGHSCTFRPSTHMLAKGSDCVFVVEVGSCEQAGRLAASLRLVASHADEPVQVRRGMRKGALEVL